MVSPHGPRDPWGLIVFLVQALFVVVVVGTWLSALALLLRWFWHELFHALELPLMEPVGSDLGYVVLLLLRQPVALPRGLSTGPERVADLGPTHPALARLGNCVIHVIVGDARLLAPSLDCPGPGQFVFVVCGHEHNLSGFLDACTEQHARHDMLRKKPFSANTVAAVEAPIIVTCRDRPKP